MKNLDMARSTSKLSGPVEADTKMRVAVGDSEWISSATMKGSSIMYQCDWTPTNMTASIFRSRERVPASHVAYGRVHQVGPLARIPLAHSKTNDTCLWKSPPSIARPLCALG